MGTQSKPLGSLPMRLHHNAFVSRDLEATRHFYEDVLGLPLVATWTEVEELLGSEREYCHLFFGLADGSALAFFHFADPAENEQFAASRRPSPFVHLALSVEPGTQDEVADRLKAAGTVPLVVEHGYCRSLYVSDPDGLLLEFTVDPPNVAEINQTRRDAAHEDLRRWLDGDHRTNNDWRAGPG
jgi:glyoxylase I family protein